MIENPFNKNKEDEKSSEIPKKRKIRVRDILLILALIIIVSGITFFLIYLEMKTKEGESVVEVPVSQVMDPSDNGQRFWHIDKAEPSESNGGLYKLTLISNAGNLRYYDNVRSYGLSQSREYLTLVSNESITTIKLIDEEQTTAKLPAQKFSSSFGDQVTWNYDNTSFALAVYTEDKTNQTKIWIFDLNGDLIKEIEANLPVSMDKKTIEPILFSKGGNFILARTYKALDAEEVKEDGSNYKVTELPIYLTVYDLNGDIIKEVMVRDYDEKGSTTVFYQWNLRDSTYLEYILHGRNEKIDPYQSYLFTKVKI